MYFILDQLWILFGQKTKKQNFSNKNRAGQFLKPSAKFFKTWRLSFWAYFGPFWPKNINQDFFYKKVSHWYIQNMNNLILGPF